MTSMHLARTWCVAVRGLSVRIRRASVVRKAELEREACVSRLSMPFARLCGVLVCGGVIIV